MNPLRAVEGPRLVAIVGLISTHVALARAAWENITIPEERAYRTKSELIQCRDEAKRLVAAFDKAIAEVSRQSGREARTPLPGFEQTFDPVTIHPLTGSDEGSDAAVTRARSEQ